MKIGVISIIIIAAFACILFGCQRDSEETQLIVASGRGDIGAIQLLLSKGVNVNCVSHGLDKSTPLIWAVSQRRERAVSVLLKAGANPHSRDGHNKTALFYAFSDREDCSEIIKELILVGANTDDCRAEYNWLNETNINRVAFENAIKLRDGMGNQSETNVAR